MPGMSPRIKLKKGRPLVGAPNIAPVVTITAFVATVATGVADGPFTATAVDDNQGDLSANIVWSTVADGVLGTGASLDLTFTTIGATETLTATVTDSFGLDGTDTQDINVTA